MKNIVSIFIGLALAACSSMSLRNQWSTKGYSADDIREIQRYEGGYLDILSRGTAFSNGFDSSERVSAENRIRGIFCSCFKKLGEKCRTKPDGLTDDDKILWAKSNAADSALHASGNMNLPLASSNDLTDGAECH